MSDDADEIELPPYVYVRIADEITADIESGKLPLGARLPGETELAEIHQVSVGTARRVRRELTRRGLVASRPASGTFVIRRRRTDAPQA
jgi:GntR family transcriptional regulator